MNMQRKSAFSRRLPDFITEEIVKFLIKKNAPVEFKQLFDTVYARLKEKHSVSGGEEMLRLRVYEKLHTLAEMSMVKKVGKKYRALAAIAKALPTKGGLRKRASVAKKAAPAKTAAKPAAAKKAAPAKRPEAAKKVAPAKPAKKAIPAKKTAPAKPAKKVTKAARKA